MTREEVIRGLECCISGNPAICKRVGCPYAEEHDGIGDTCIDHLMADALALLKAQEPRVMTVEEVKAFEWDYCYLEQERQPGKEYRMIMGDYALTCITWPCITSMRIEYGDSSYGVKWRCWTSRPTDEQREAVPWE